MTEQEHIRAVQAALPEDGFAPPEALTAVEAALQEYPRSPQLWCLRGDLIQLSDDANDGLELTDALRSYERALEIDPAWADAHEAMGHFLDAVLDDPERAAPHFERAADLRGDAAVGGA